MLIHIHLVSTTRSRGLLTAPYPGLIVTYDRSMGFYRLTFLPILRHSRLCLVRRPRANTKAKLAYNSHSGCVERSSHWIWSPPQWGSYWKEATASDLPGLSPHGIITIHIWKNRAVMGAIGCSRLGLAWVSKIWHHQVLSAVLIQENRRIRHTLSVPILSSAGISATSWRYEHCLRWCHWQYHTRPDH